MMHPNDRAKRLRDAIARGAHAKAAQDRRIAARDIEVGPVYGPYDPAAPDNNAAPQHPVGDGTHAAVSYPLFGHPGTRFQEISTIANIIPRSSYPVGTVEVYLGMNRPLEQMEADWLNEHIGDTP